MEANTEDKKKKKKYRWHYTPEPVEFSGNMKNTVDYNFKNSNINWFYQEQAKHMEISTGVDN